ncbi:bifunctional phosphopantothenoylcysteine decarboxylase/phosphopantothenate--cysteine ligase CoaBC [Nesterenkonia alba]|uniref:bifunctional phosphopantothenoylcysteine decarboxylase/phosphopantothenate--cysteine ligase CoaBC n=1 Tax=Nesterenkonia alba TaxID=515814 RepID=UPI0003B73FD2|nr:bifunctional phosphopantothenoylcysteine decarboxylase/phosphopantothenate--cysteine ligase CoaBC [Nesterenkonia alba]
MRIVLGVTAGIAAYKSAHLLRLLTEAGHTVDVVPTPSSEKFVGRATWEALSGRPVTTGVFDSVDTVRHVRLGQQADLVVVAPATADLLARVRAGMANDLLTSTLLVTRAPVLMVPAMHTEMWQHPATVDNVAVLQQRGLEIMEPATGRLTGVDSGAGRMPEPEQIAARIEEILSAKPATESASSPGTGPLTGARVVVTAGGTREPLDPVRYLGNRSSGKQGIALARAAARAGARVQLIAAVTDGGLPTPAEGIDIVRVETTAELRRAVLSRADEADVLIMAAAVADFRPAASSQTKIKKTFDGAPVIELTTTEDILAETVRRRRAGAAGPRVIVGFAAETGDEHTDPLQLAQQKLERKGCDLLVLNRVGEGLVFGQDSTEVHILSAPQYHAVLGTDPVTLRGTKDEAAERIVEHTATVLTHQG